MTITPILICSKVRARMSSQALSDVAHPIDARDAKIKSVREIGLDLRDIDLLLVLRALRNPLLMRHSRRIPRQAQMKQIAWMLAVFEHAAEPDQFSKPV